jgi:hypothetical protein
MNVFRLSEIGQLILKGIKHVCEKLQVSGAWISIPNRRHSFWYCNS